MKFIVLDNVQKASSKMLCDKHVTNLPNETCQILCNVQHLLKVKRKDIPYNPINTKHPVVLWAKESLSNYMWLMDMLYFQQREYTYRFSKQHKVTHTYEWLRVNIPQMDDKGLTPFPLMMPDKYKSGDIIESYRKFYMNEKKDMLKYTKRRKPKWLV